MVHHHSMNDRPPICARSYADAPGRTRHVAAGEEEAGPLWVEQAAEVVTAAEAAVMAAAAAAAVETEAKAAAAATLSSRGGRFQTRASSWLR